MRYQPMSLPLIVVLACATAACSDRLDPASPLDPGTTVARAASGNGGSPAPTGFTLIADDLCPGIHLELRVSGAAKTLIVGKAGAVTIFLSPGLEATLTNLADPARTVTLNITGASHQTVNAGGELVTMMTGRNLAFDPVAEPHFALVEGVFSFAFDAEVTLVQPRAGQGRVTDVCALVA